MRQQSGLRQQYYVDQIFHPTAGTITGVRAGHRVELLSSVLGDVHRRHRGAAQALGKDRRMDLERAHGADDLRAPRDDVEAQGREDLAAEERCDGELPAGVAGLV